MKYKFLGLLLICLPLIIFTAMRANSSEFFWYLSSGHKIYDLMYAVLLFLVVALGIRLIAGKRHFVVNVFFCTIFVVYQILGWTFDSYRHISLLPLDDGKHTLLVVPHDVGAFSSSSWVTLEVAKNKYGLFLQFKRVKSFPDIRSADIKINDDQNSVIIHLTSFSGAESTEKFVLQEILP